MSWRIHCDERGWRAFLSFNHTPADRTTLDVQHGAGIDFNVDHLPLTEIDMYDNMLRT